MYEEISIALKPYLSSSENLIDVFAIIGYDENMINLSENILENQNNLELIVISKIICESFQSKINFKDIIKKIYPEKPNIIPKSGFLKPQSTNVIFSSCIDSINGKKKLFYSCYVLRFYEEFRDINAIEYYIPKAFLIYSKYPYFTAFYNICLKLQIYNDFYVDDQILLEILIYCLVNYIPSPIKNSIILMDFRPNISIPKLTAHPYIDFNLCQIFKTIPIKEFIKIYILVFLELDVLFFSPNLEKLNLFMYIQYILNYPLLDSTYFWHIKSISINDFKLATEFLMGSFFLGVNANYTPNINLTHFKNLNFIINLENEKNIINYIYQSKESEETHRLINYISNLLNHKENNSVFLKDCVLSLKHKLKKIKKEYDSKKGKINNINNFFYIDPEINKINKQIQEAFYDFNLTILKILNYDYKYDYSTLTIIKNKKIQEQKFIDEENIFLKYFRYTVKYSCYFINFISYFNSVDEFKLFFLFSDEFANLKNSQLSKVLSDNYFYIMDSFFVKSEPDKINFNKLIEKFNLFSKQKLTNNLEKQSKNQLISLDNNIINEFLSYRNNNDFFKSLKDKEIKDMNIKSIKMAKISLTIQDNFNKFLNKKYFIRSSIVYIFSIIFPFFSFCNGILFLSNILFTFKEINYFQRFYLTIFLKSFSKYYSINNINFNFPELTFENFKSYCELIKEQLIKNSILPNEEIYKFFLKLLSEDKNKYIKNKVKNKEDQNIINNLFIYKYSKEKVFINEINKDIIVKKENNLIFNFKGETIKYKLKSDSLLFLQISLFYEDYFTRLNFNIEYINVNNITEIIINLIYYLFQLDYLDMSCFLLNGIILLKEFKKELDLFRKANKIGNNNI